MKRGFHAGGGIDHQTDVPAGIDRSIALGFIHPIAIMLTSVFAVGFSACAVSGERQRGTLEVALARLISRRALYLTPRRTHISCRSFSSSTPSDRRISTGRLTLDPL